MTNKDFNSILEIIRTFPTEQDCIDHLEAIRWNGNVVSPFSPESKVYNCKGNRYKCKETGKYFNVKTNTLFDNTKVDLQKWFVAIWLVTSHKKGISSIQLSKDIGVTQKTGWFMLQRIRNCFGIDHSDDDQLTGEVEIDETYVGGKAKNRKKAILRDKSFGTKDRLRKSVVMGMVQRDGELRAKHVGNGSASQLLPQIDKNISKDATIYSDELTVYRGLHRVYDHKAVMHGKKEYVRGRVHTNTIESFWAILKRGIFGVYHFTSRKHLHFYVDEFVFRYNSRDFKEADRFNLFLSQSENRLTYKELING